MVCCLFVCLFVWLRCATREHCKSFWCRSIFTIIITMGRQNSTVQSLPSFIHNGHAETRRPETRCANNNPQGMGKYHLKQHLQWCSHSETSLLQVDSFAVAVAKLERPSVASFSKTFPKKWNYGWPCAVSYSSLVYKHINFPYPQSRARVENVRKHVPSNSILTWGDLFGFLGNQTNENDSIHNAWRIASLCRFFD